ncbi:hypothetical protein V6N11_079436 [Hibiscus sabdariffa]|uniref:RNase H type-1 domain-containing protein n=1 Tax=Hibiscus sabdariffa TaxID=183260 RepID=A0ABR2RW35_9ROSI
MPSITRMPLVDTWIALEVGCLKFNANAAVRESFGEAGICGVLKDHCGKILMRFSKSIDRSNPTGAELAAIFEECQGLVRCMNPSGKRHLFVVPATIRVSTSSHCLA